MEHPFSIFPLGDSAITIDLGNHIEEQLNSRALAIKCSLEARPFPGLRDIIVAYSSVSVFYDPVQVRAGVPACNNGIYEYMRHRLEEAWVLSGKIAETGSLQSNVRIPVCYGAEYGPDLDFLARERGMSTEEAIKLHCAVVYRVYMIGFLPGFSYLGKVDARLETSRKKQPVPVMAGSIGIAGNQTGIYPLKSPGGWQIIGRTPVRLFDVRSVSPVKLRIGDRVEFFPVDKEVFLGMSAEGATVDPASMPFRTINDRDCI